MRFLLLIIGIISCSPYEKKSQSEESVNDRKQLLIQHVASFYPEFSDGLRPPGFDGNLSDFGKYNYPKILAVFHEYGDTVKRWNDQLDLYSQKPTFHFNLLGLPRILYQFPNAPGVRRNELAFLKRVFERTDSYNAWTSEGTENHIMMSRASGYLYAQLALEKYPEKFPEATEKLSLMREWIEYFSNRILETGTGEFNSSIYGSYNIIPWVNLYDFATNEEVKSLAKQVLDYYASELALNYIQGMIGGADLRGKGNYRSFSGSAAYLAWLWFGDSPTQLSVENLNQGSRNATHLAQNVHAAMSPYVPSKQILDLSSERNGMYYNSKPDYLMNEVSFIRHSHYKTKDYHLGAGYFPYGGWSSGNFQIVPWKLLSRADLDSSAKKSVQYLAGIGVQTPTSSYMSGNMRSPFDQLVHHKNILIQMTRLPEDGKEIQETIRQLFPPWQEDWAVDFQKRFPADEFKLNEENPVNFQKIDLSENKSHLILHPNGGYWNQTNHKGALILELEKSWLIIQSVRGNALSSFVEQQSKKQNYQVVTVSAKKGQVCGFVLEVLGKSKYSSLTEVENAFTKIELNEIAEGQTRLQYVSSTADTLDVAYNTTGSFSEPIFDWGYGYYLPTHIVQRTHVDQPKWPSGEGHGKLATWTVNGELIDLTKQWPVYSGDGIFIGEGRMEFN